MQTLVFNTQDKTTQLWSNEPGLSMLLYEFRNTPTVKVCDNHYEVMMKTDDGTIPVLRVPICNTIMLIQK